MPWIISAQYDDEEGRERHEPRFVVETSEADALALSMRLNRAASLTFMTAQYPVKRRGLDHAQWTTAGLESLQAMDPAAVPGTLYSVGQAIPYAGPDESAATIAAITAMMTAYAQHSANPPATPHEAVFRTIRDAPPPPPEEPPPVEP